LTTFTIATKQYGESGVNSGSEVNVMKNRILSAFVALAILAGIYQAHAAVTFTVTPSAISNTYSGIVTLNIGGITAGDTVEVQKFLDADSNSVPDSSAILWQQFQITDGQASVFTNGTTSVTNFNVPGDTDGSANGSITANLFPGMDFAQTIVGKYFYVLSSPAGHFTAVTNSFLVTNFPFAQSFSGNVVNHGTNVPDAVVILFQPANGGQNPQGGVVANNTGGYSIATAPGTYELVAVKSNFVANLASSPTVALGAGAAIVTNVPLTNATETISGRVVDANNSSLGISGYLLPLQTQDNLLAIGFTDTNGNFSTGVTSDQWEISKNETSLLVKGYLTTQGKTIVDTTTGSVSGVTVALPKETAIFYGKVTNSSGTPLTGAEIEAQDNSSGYDGEGVAFTNGNYVAAAIGGNGDQWQVQYDQNGPANYVYSQPAIDQNGGTNINVGQAIQVNLTGLSAPNTISGNVKDSNGNPVAGLGVNANATINNVSYNVSNTDTDTNGNYSMNVANGVWSVNVNCGDGGDGLQDIYTNGNAQCPNNDSVTNSNNNGTADFVIQLTSGSGDDQINGYVTDTNGNPIVGVSVYANNEMGTIYTNDTDGSGYYSFNVNDGTWYISVDCGQLSSLGYDCASDQDISTCCGNTYPVNFTVQPSPSSPYPFQTLYGFSASALNANELSTNSDGASPHGGLVLSGNTLYGAAQYGGTNGAGTIFAISTTLTNFVVEHTFSAPAPNSEDTFTNSDGGVPSGTLLLSSNLLYGTAAYGGIGGSGTVFKMTTNGASFNVLRTFTIALTNAPGFYTNSDGANPLAGLVLSSNLLYSTASGGGTNGNGVIFSVTTNGSFAVLHTFPALDAATETTNNDGALPYGGLLLSGNTLYGTAAFGGVWGFGTIFAINTNGSGFTVLYSFTGGDDGANPQAGLILSGNILIGTAADGGADNAGTVFAINTNKTGFIVLHSFTGGDDGASPSASLTLSSNILYGTAASGGAGGNGTVFAVNTNTLVLTVLHAFTGGNDGANPYGNLILSGNTLYGTTVDGGIGGDGTVFAVSTIPLPSAPSLSGTYSHDQFQITVSGAANENYTVQMATNLVAPNWISLLVTNPPSTPFLFTDPNATNKQRFYRVLEEQ
jgi:uncharacterized repeat protein (TIGR03803 family)